MPPDLDSEIEAAAIASGTTYSAWLAALARKEFPIRDGLAGVAQSSASTERLTGVLRERP